MQDNVDRRYQKYYERSQQVTPVLELRTALNALKTDGYLSENKDLDLTLSMVK